MRVAYLGPAGTFSHEALLAHRLPDVVEVPQTTIADAVLAVHDGSADRALVPIENSLEGGVNATLDTLALEAEGVFMIGEHVERIRLSLVAKSHIELDTIDAVISHPQPLGQCQRFLRTRLPNAKLLTAASTAEGARLVASEDPPAGVRCWAAIAPPAAARRFGCQVLLADVEDLEGNETRFVWLSRGGPDAGSGGPWKTSLVFWGVGAEAPGWLVRCLSQFSERGVNLTRIESRPRKLALGRYMFFVDLEGKDDDPTVADAISGLRGQAQTVKVLGSYPAAV